MTIELTPEMERALVMEATRTGETPAAVASRFLQHFFRLGDDGTKSRNAALGAPIVPETPVTPEGLEARVQRAREAMRVVRDGVEESFGPQRGVRYRDWIHEDHKY